MSLLVFTIRLCNALFFLNVILLENKVKTLPHSALSTLCDHAFLFLVPQMDCSATCSIIFPGFEDKLTGFKFLESVSSLKKKKKTRVFASIRYFSNVIIQRSSSSVWQHCSEFF